MQILICAWLISYGSVADAKAGAPIDPLTVSIDASDAMRFAVLFNETDGKPTARQLQERYLDRWGYGVSIFTPNRIMNAENLAGSVQKSSPLYRHAIETCLPVLDKLSADLRSIYLAYHGLFPDRALPAVYVVFGAGNSGGTAAADAQVIGLEVMCQPGTSAEQFRSKMRSMLAHEPVHSWPSRPEAAILVILENTSGTGWLLLTIAHARNDVPLR